MEEATLWKQLMLQVVLVFINAIFACAEIAVLSANTNRLEVMKKEGNKKARRILYLMEEPSRFLSTIQVAITFAGFLASAFAADNFAGRLVDLILKLGLDINIKTLNTISVVIITVILSYFTLVLES